MPSKLSIQLPKYPLQSSRPKSLHWGLINPTPTPFHYIVVLLMFHLLASGPCSRITLISSSLKTSTIAITLSLFYRTSITFSHSSFTKISTPSIPSLFAEHTAPYLLLSTPRNRVSCPLLFVDHIHPLFSFLIAH